MYPKCATHFCTPNCMSNEYHNVVTCLYGVGHLLLFSWAWISQCLLNRLCENQFYKKSHQLSACQKLPAWPTALFNNLTKLKEAWFISAIWQCSECFMPFEFYFFAFNLSVSNCDHIDCSLYTLLVGCCTTSNEHQSYKSDSRTL